MSERTVGELGEATLYQWCAQVGITANKAANDRHGWDYILEFPVATSVTPIRIPLDKMPSPLKCWVQVKATDGTNRAWSIKLSTWWELINNPLPVFFLALEFNHQNNCQAAFLVHVDKGYIEKVQKRLRELSLEESVKLNRRSLQFTWGEEHAIVSLDGQGIVNAIRAYIPNGIEAYALEKIRMVNEVGYEEARQKFHLRIPIPSDTSIEKYLVDFVLGLLPRVPIVYGEVRDCRFGIEWPEPEYEFQDGYMEVDTEKSIVGKGEIILRTADGFEELTLTPDVYVPYGLGISTSEEQQKIRLACPYLDFILHRGQNPESKVTLSYPDLDEILQLENLIPMAKFVLLINKALESQYKTLRFEFRYATQLGSAGHFEFDSLPPEYLELATVISHAWTIAKHFDIQHQVMLKILELLYQQKRLMFMDSILGTQHGNMKVVFHSSEQPPSDKSMCLPYIKEALIGQYRLAIAVAVIGDPQPTGIIDAEHGTQYEIITRDVRLHRHHCYNREDTPRYSLEALHQSVIEAYEEPYRILILDS